MASIGERLRQAREQAGLTLSDVAARTKIQRWILDDIERDDLSRVPGGVFVRGYLTSFARVVGLDGELLWAEHRAAVATVEAPVVERAAVPLVSRWTIVRVATIVIVAAIIWVNATHQKPATLPVRATPAAPDTRDIAPAVATAGSAATPVAAVDTPANTPATAPAPAPTTAALVLQVHATSECWIEASADGEQKAYRLLMPGEDLRLEGAKQIRLLVGNAAAVTYSINGRPGRPLGASGIVREIVVPATGYEGLVEPSAG